MRGKILSKALELLYEGAMNQVNFFAAVLNAGYGAGSGRIEYEYQKRKRALNEKRSRAEMLQDRKRKLTIFISKMKHDGLIETTENSELRISHKGVDKLNKLRNTLPSRFYKKNLEKSGSTIISFDIPENLRSKRDWLREVIRNLGFELIHKSVWLGKGKVPVELVKDLEDLKILEFVEIFQISKGGSLRKIT